MKYLLLTLLLCSLAFAQPIDWFAAKQAYTDLNVSSFITLIPSGPLPYVEQLKVDVSFVPRSSPTVNVEYFEAFPDALATSERVRYTWAKPSREVSFGYQARILSEQNVPPVRAKIPFPLRITEFEEYTTPTKHIDSNSPTVKAQAALLAKDQDDLFSVVSSIGIWVKNNVNYNLTTLTADVSQPASWVLEQRTGVCDELTSLFIAMLRSLGIPARFVSGVAFTNSAQFPSGWGAHGWAEVYFPGVGWVPYDPTFGEFGWVDPGHIPLKYSDDPQEPATVYEWKARDTKVEVHDLTITAAHIGATGFAENPLRLSLSPIRQRVGFGSANGVVLNVENTGDRYVAWEFTLSRVKDMEILGPESEQIILAPKSSGQLFWTVKVANNLNEQYQYELPLVVSTIRNDTARASFFVGQWDAVVPLAEVRSAQNRLNVSASDIFELSCALASDRISIAVGTVECSLKNNKPVELTVNLCHTSCQLVAIGPNEKVSKNFEVLAQVPGPHEVEVTASAGQLNKSAILTLTRMDKPKVGIKDIEAPNTVAYGSPLEVTFTVARESISTPLNVTVRARDAATVDLGALSADQHVTIKATGDQIVANHLPLRVDYADEQGNSYFVETDVAVVVTSAPWYKPLLDWLRELF